MQPDPHRTPVTPGPPRDLDRGLNIAFGREEHSVLAAIARITGATSGVHLRDAPSAGGEPLIDPSTSERRSIPQGRGNYQLLGEIARGGMGVVMKGHDTDLGRDVALKVLHKELAGRPEVLQRFVEEAQIGGQLQHPGIVPVYELGLMADERPYFTMKLVKGRTLAVLLSERKVTGDERRRLLDVFESMCQTLAYAHSRGVIHRDLKPANVMVGAFGEVQVVDWGLAKVLRHGGTADEQRAKQSNISIIETVRSEPGSHGSNSQVGSVMGTPAYMSPEQARGEVEKLDERSDVFSLGAILCEILTGSPPYVGEQEKTLVLAASAKLDDATKRLEQCDADQDLVALAKECLAPAQHARPRSAEVLAQRIHGHLVSVEERARQAQVEAAEARVKAREERRARKLTVGLAGSVLVTVLVAGGGWAWMSQEKTQRERGTESQVNAALNEAKLRQGEGKWAEALASVERAKGLADSGAASGELRAIVAREFAATEEDARRARAKDDLARDNAALLAELADIRRPEGDTYYATDWAKLDADHRAIFVRHGFHLDEQSVTDAADALNVRGIPVELAAALDEWATVRSGADDKTGARQLSNLARRIDADETRGKLRDALLASNVGALRAFAAGEDLASLPTTTLDLLGSALKKNGAEDEAIAVYRRAQLLHPSDFTISMNLARILKSASQPRLEEAARSFTAALALRPSSVEAAHQLGMTLDDNSLHDRARAAEVFAAAVALRPDDEHLKGHLASSLGDLDGALAAWRKAAELDPKNAAAQRSVGITLRNKGDFDGAIEADRKAIALDPNNASAHSALGFALTDRGDLEGAIASGHTAVALDPKLVLGYFSLGNALYKKGDNDGALAAYRKALELEPKNALAYCSVGNALDAKGDHDGAISSARKAIELDPKYAGAYVNLGRALHEKGDFEDAIAVYRTAIGLDPTQADPYLNLALVLGATGDLAGEIAADRKASELDPKNATAWCNLGRVLDDTDDHDGAMTAFRKAIELDPNDAAARCGLGGVLFEKGDIDAAIEALRSAIEADPKLAIAYGNLSNALSVKGDLDGSLEAARAAVAIDPKYSGGYGNLGVALFRKGEFDGAIEATKKAIDLAPNQAGLYRLLGLAFRGKGDPDQAIAALSKSIELEPQDASGQYHLGRALQTKGDLDGAIAAFRRAIELVPGDAANFHQLGAVLCRAGKWSQAIEALDRSIGLTRANDETGPYSTAIDHCFLATAHAHVGDLDKAREHYELARTWHAANPNHANAGETGRLLDDARAAIAGTTRR